MSETEWFQHQLGPQDLLSEYAVLNNVPETTLLEYEKNKGRGPFKAGDKVWLSRKPAEPSPVTEGVNNPLTGASVQLEVTVRLEAFVNKEKFYDDKVELVAPPVAAAFKFMVRQDKVENAPDLADARFKKWFDEEQPVEQGGALEMGTGWNVRRTFLVRPTIDRDCLFFRPGLDPEHYPGDIGSVPKSGDLYASRYTEHAKIEVRRVLGTGGQASGGFFQRVEIQYLGVPPQFLGAFNLRPAVLVKAEHLKREFVCRYFLPPDRGYYAWLSARREIKRGLAKYPAPALWADKNQRGPLVDDYAAGVVVERQVSKANPKGFEWCGIFQGYNHMNAGFRLKWSDTWKFGAAKSIRGAIFQSTVKFLSYWQVPQPPQPDEDRPEKPRWLPCRDYFSDNATSAYLKATAAPHRPYLRLPRKAELWTKYPDRPREGGRLKRFDELTNAELDAFGRWLQSEAQRWLMKEFLEWDPRRGDILVVNASYQKVPDPSGRPSDQKLALEGQFVQKIASHFAMVGEYDPENFVLVTYEGNHAQRGGAWRWNLASVWDDRSRQPKDTGLFQFYSISRFVEGDYDRPPGNGRIYGKTSETSDPTKADLEAAASQSPPVEQGDTFAPTSKG